MTRSATSWFSRNDPDCQSIASTSVVFPWSTCATIATLRRSSRRLGLDSDTAGQRSDGCPRECRHVALPACGAHRGRSALSLPNRALRLAALLGVLAGTAAPGGLPASEQAGCRLDRAYAGIEDASARAGIRGTLSVVSTPIVKIGYVAGWVGVGGVHASPDGRGEWLQIGYAAFDSGRRELYWEVALPGRRPRYHTVKPRVAPGERHVLAVLELAGRHGSWRAWLDDRPASPVFDLPDSHGRLKAQAMAESWNGGTRVCNSYGYAFSDVQISTAPGGLWQRGEVGYSWHDARNRLV